MRRTFANPYRDRSLELRFIPVFRKFQVYVRKGDTLLVSKLDRLARSTVDLYNIVEQLQAKDVEFRVIDDPSIDTTSRTGKLVMGILALIAEFENDIRRERQMDGIAKAKLRACASECSPSSRTRW